MQLKIYRCRICGEVYLGYSAAENCPFCGAHVEFLEAPEAYPVDINDLQITESERADLEASVELETANCRFYLGMAQRKDNEVLRVTYKRLAKVEAEHCELFCKLLRVDQPADLLTPGETTGAWATDIEESLRRENRASHLYTTFADRATNERLKEVWSAVAEVEADHITLDELAKTYL
ncbi:MAG: rubredoxin-like domain-containing protein [Coriobacteriia bacterium]|jgi:rubrerythrin